MALFGFGKKKGPELCGICGRELQGAPWQAADGKYCGDCRDRLMASMPDEQRQGLTLAQLKLLLSKTPEPAEEPAVPEGGCPVCGGPMDNPTAVSDGEICENCDKLLRGEYFRWMEITDHHHPEHGKKVHWEPGAEGKTVDRLASQSLESLKKNLDSKRARQKEVLERCGSEYSSVFQVDELFSFSVSAIKGGMVRAMRLKGRPVVRGIVMKGQFSKDDPVFLIHDGESFPLSILEAVSCDGGDFELEVSANLLTGPAHEGSCAWLILSDMFLEISEGDLIVI